MRLVADLKLKPQADQSSALMATLECANEAAEWLSGLAWQRRVFRRYDLHAIAYFKLRERFGLSAQMAVRVISKVADSYRLDRATRRTFRPRGAIAYDSRILRYRLDRGTISIWTLYDRIEIPFVCGKRQIALLANQRGESDLVWRDGAFYLLATCESAEPEPYRPEASLGVDLGIANLATDSTGQAFSGEGVDARRRRYDRIKRRLQRRGTRSARRHLQRTRRRESRFRRCENHRIAKQLVAKARRHRAQIVLEDLGGIRARTTVRKRQRRRHTSWGFAQLREMIAYKAALQGVPVVLVDPSNTSRECPRCGHTSKRNRPARDRFLCQACGHVAPADHNAATVIAARAGVRRPIVTSSEYATSHVHLSRKPPALAVGS